MEQHNPETAEYDFADEIVTACYLCHGQCANFGVHGKGVRPCAKGVSEIIHRRQEMRQQSRSRLNH